MKNFYHKQFATVIRSEVLQWQLLSKEDLTFDDAVKLAQAFEAAKSNVKALEDSASGVATSPVGKLSLKKSLPLHAIVVEEEITLQMSAD